MKMISTTTLVDRSFRPSIIITDTHTEQFRFPKSRRRRIRKKWKRRPENHRPSRSALMCGDSIIVCHPEFADALRRECPWLLF